MTTCKRYEDCLTCLTLKLTALLCEYSHLDVVMLPQVVQLITNVLYLLT